MRTHLSFGVAFYIRQNRNRLKDYSICCCIKVGDSAPREISIQGKIAKGDWDAGKGRPKPKTEELARLSLHLEKIKARLLQIYQDLEVAGGLLTAENVKDIYLGKTSPNYTLLALIDKATEKYKTEIAKGSLKNYHATRSYVEAFCGVKYRSGDIPLRQLTYAFIDELKTYILTHPIKSNDPCTHNGCMKHMERLKKMVIWAYEMRFMDRDVFGSFKIKMKRHETTKLNWEQLKAIEAAGLQRPMLRLVRDLFVFCCYTGMAPYDMQHLRPHQISHGMDGLTWLTYTRDKSKIPAYVPLLKPAMELINGYRVKKSDLSFCDQ